MRTAFHLFRLLWSQERAHMLASLTSMLLFPLALTYISFRLADDAEPLLRRYMAAGITLAFGSTVLEVGGALLDDRFRGRLALLRCCAVSKSEYYGVRVGLGVLHALTVVALALAIAAGLGYVRITVDLALASVVTAVASGASLGGAAAFIALRAESADAGHTALAFLAVGVALLSPLYYSPDSLPSALRPLLWVSPYSYIPPQIVAALSHQPVPAAYPLAAFVLAAVVNISSYRKLTW